MRIIVRLVVWTWFLGAIVVGRLGVLERLPAPTTQAILVALTGLLLAVSFGIAAVRTWLLALDPRALVLLHVVRFVGVYFLVLYHRGQLPYAFAVLGGCGDIVVAFLALGVVFVPMRAEIRRRACLVWNTIGLVDIAFVVGTAARIAWSQPEQLAALRRLPLSVLPTFLVPLIIATHVIIFACLRQKSQETANPP